MIGCVHRVQEYGKEIRTGGRDDLSRGTGEGYTAMG